MAKMGKNFLLFHKQIKGKAKINYVEKLLKNIYLAIKILINNTLAYMTYPQGFNINP
jgi:hypothetical protein